MNNIYEKMVDSMNTKAGYNANIEIEAKTWSMASNAQLDIVNDMGKFLTEAADGSAKLADSSTSVIGVASEVRCNCVLTTFKSQYIYVRCLDDAFVAGDKVYVGNGGLASAEGTDVVGYALGSTQLDLNGVTKLLPIRINL